MVKKNSIKVFLSLPMSGRTDEAVFAEIEQIKNIFMDYINDTQPGTEVEFVNTYVQPSAPENCVTEPLWYLGESIKILSTCDAIIFAQGFRGARGCMIEYEVARNYDLKYYKLFTDYNTRWTLLGETRWEKVL